MIKAALALYHKVLPPTCKVTPADRAARRGDSPFYCATRRPGPGCRSPGHPRRAAVSAFGFGGSNFHCVLEEAGPAKPAIDWDGDVQILAFSAAVASRDRECAPGARSDSTTGPRSGHEGAQSRSRFRVGHATACSWWSSEARAT